MQLRDELRQDIVGRTLTPGAPLPTEEELRQQYGVSRSVVRQALASLEGEGLVDRRRGRGSIVTTPLAHHRRVEQAGGLREHYASLGMELRTELRAFELATPPDEVAGELDATKAWCLHRVRFIDDEASISMRTWVPHDRFPGLSAGLLGSGSLLEALARLGARPVGGPRRFQAVAAPADIAADLDIDVNSPVVLMSGVTADVDGGALEIFRAWHHPRMVFNTEARVLMSPESEGADPRA